MHLSGARTNHRSSRSGAATRMELQPLHRRLDGLASLPPGGGAMQRGLFLFKAAGSLLSQRDRPLGARVLLRCRSAPAVRTRQT